MMSETEINRYVQQLISSEASKMLRNLGSIKDFEKMVLQLLPSIDGNQIVKLFLRSAEEEPSATKDSVKSKKIRNKGNKLYAKSKTMDDFFEVFRAYNESIAYAPIKSEELALSYANRAMVLFRLKYFNECLTDINRALCSNYPDKTMGKLLIKKIRCMKIVNHPDLQLIYNDCLEWIDKHAENVQELRTEIKKAFEEDAPPCRKSMDITQFRDDLLEEMKKSCPNLDKVEIGRSNKDELALVAARDIHAGEVVAVQKMYTQIFNMEIPHLSCGQCIQMCLIPVPCDSCSKVMYCSESCKAEAWSKHHEYECQIMSFFQGLKWRLYTPAMISIYAMKQLGGILPLMKEVYKMSKTDDMEKEHRIVDGVYPSESYRSVYYMANKFPVDIKLNYSAEVARVSAFVYLIATRTTLFNKQYRGDFSTVMKDRLPNFFVSLIIRHTVMVQDLQMFSKSVGGRCVMSWAPVCPLFYIMNHSCNPNSVKLTIKDHHVLVAIDEIKKGQVIDFSFFRRPLVQEPLAHRRKFTEQQLTRQCHCKVCATNVSHNLPSFQVLEKNPQKLRELSIINRRIEKCISNHEFMMPTSADRYLQQSAELFRDLQPFFAMAPPLCKEAISFKNYLLNKFYSSLQDVVYNSYLEWEAGDIDLNSVKNLHVILPNNYQ